MQILALSKLLFDQYMEQHGVTDETVAEQTNLAFISINNHERDTEPWFKKDHRNVKVMWFDDVDQDYEVPSVGTPGKMIHVKAFTLQQAKELFNFIKANKDKKSIVVHCTAGVSRSGAVATFINDFVSGNWEQFKRFNPSIQPNAHVYRLLHDVWYEDHAHNDSITGKRINPRSKEQEIALYNAEHPEQHTSIELLSKEQVIEKYGYEFAKFPEQNFDGTAIITTNKYCNDSELKYGIYGQHFQIPFDYKFENGDIIECGHKDLKPLFVTDDPITHVIEYLNDGTRLEYWLHTVKIATNNPGGYFYPRKFLLPGMRFYKIPTFNDSRKFFDNQTIQ